MTGRVLVVDDERSMCDLLAEALSRRGFEVATVLGGDAALEQLEAADFDAIITDVNMRGMNGIDLCQRIAANRPDTPVIVLTAFGSFETAVAAMRAGAYDFVTKPVEVEALDMALRRAVQHRALREEVKRLRQAVDGAQRFENMIGESPAMRKLFDLIARVADSDATVLITGESGSGKELVARALHRQSRRRRDRPFVAVNCAAMPEALLESELFGHVAGAFTGANKARAGLFASANGGTILLDEIAEMPPALQAKLLRAVQERTVRPVGGDQEAPFDVRIVASTNKDLEAAVEEGRFREDLFFRISVVPIEVPPLRTRGNDILLLAQHFVWEFATRQDKRIDGWSNAAAEKLLAYSWPGNVRELRNVVERAVALTNYERITPEDLPEKVRNYETSRLVLGDDPSELVSLDEMERRYIQRVLEAFQGNRTLAARALGLDRKTLYRKLGAKVAPPAE